MTNRMERFSQRARTVLSLAQEAAESLQHYQIGTEHLLLGLMREDGGIAGRVLRDLALDPRRVEELASSLSDARVRRGAAQLDLSLGTKKALESAVDEARRMGHGIIGAEHLLLGLLRTQDGAALDILRELNVSREQIRRNVIAIMQRRPATSRQIDPPQPARQSALRVVDYFLLRMTSRSSGEVSHFAVDLSPAVKDALEEALKEATHTGKLQLEEGHLLLGLILNQDSALTRLLLNAGVDLEKLLIQMRQRGDD